MSHAAIQLQAYGLGAAALIGVAFFACRRVAAFALVCAALVCAFAAYSSTRASRSADWLVTTFGLAALAIGLMLVRAMLQRSVSLHLLEAVERGGSASFAKEIKSRIADMRRFGLIRSDAGKNALTRFGLLIAFVTGTCYCLLQIDE